MKGRSLREREGCRSLRRALASIWRMRSRVTAKNLAHFLERVLAAVIQAETHLDDLLLARRQRFQHGLRLLAAS